MKTLVFLITLFSAGWAQAQVSPVQNVNINDAQLEWTWTKGLPPNDGIPDKFVIGCGQNGVVTKTTNVLAIARAWPIRQLIAGSGDWFCSVIAANVYGEAVPSPSIFFGAGAIPSPATSPKLGVKMP
jgi:hypothetical protein